MKQFIERKSHQPHIVKVTMGTLYIPSNRRYWKSNLVTSNAHSLVNYATVSRSKLFQLNVTHLFVKNLQFDIDVDKLIGFSSKNNWKTA